MVLLTSAQVNVAVSSAVVASFTVALFLSGYTIQQRTVRSLRAAIRPAPAAAPRLVLPDRFRDATTERADGTVVVLDAYSRPMRIRAGRGPADSDDSDGDSDGGGGGQGVADAPAAGPDGARPLRQEVLAMAAPPAGAGGAAPRDPQAQPQPREPAPAPWEIRREDMAEEEEEEEAGSPGSTGDGAPPMSRAERRRKIKEEIQRLAQGDTPLYYQRRLW